MSDLGAKQPLFLRAARGEMTERVPIWVMRQAGRYLPEYRAIREKHSFWEVCRTPELALEVTMQPIRRFGLDAAILFSDIMTPLESMGVEIEFKPGPVIEHPLRDLASVQALRVPEAGEITPYVMDAIRLMRAELPVPLIGFGGAPLTLATYLVQGQGSKEYEHLRAFLRTEPDAAHQLLDKLTQMLIHYLRAQVEAGAQAIQLFDSWAGLHDRSVYARFGAPYAKRIFEALADLDVPRIYIAVHSSHLYEQIATLPVEVVSVDWRLPLSEIRPLFAGKTLQGNLDPSVLLAPKEVIVQEATKVLNEGASGPHIFNLGHGIFRQTPPEHMATLVQTVQAYSRKNRDA